jgi:hypothetical protein
MEFFVAEVEGKAQRVDELKWGDETKRLPPALVEAVAEKYRVEPGSQSELQAAEKPATSAPVRCKLPAFTYSNLLVRIRACSCVR